MHHEFFLIFLIYQHVMGYKQSAGIKSSLVDQIPHLSSNTVIIDFMPYSNMFIIGVHKIILTQNVVDVFFFFRKKLSQN